MSFPLTTIAITDAPPQRKKRVKELETHRAFAERHGVSPRTIDRWTRAGLLPKPIRINKRKYWSPSTQPRRDAETAAA
jgi:DNA-binding transcriptional MerR regulator